MGINQFTDLTTQEFIEQILTNNLMDMDPSQAEKLTIQEEAPESCDWRGKNVMTPVKNQGQCGSCWAFSTTETLESAIAIGKGPLNSFSEQQLVDCCGKAGFNCQGCNGAWPDWAYNYINSAGIVLEAEYPYTARTGTCKDVPTAKKYLNTAKPWSFLSDLDSLKSSLASAGPVSICVDASNWSMYRSGIFKNCGTGLNHAVVAVGY